MPVGSVVRNSSAARHRSQGERFKSFFFQHFAGREDQGGLQIAMMVGLFPAFRC
jgi:hypothetical protein